MAQKSGRRYDVKALGEWVAGHNVGEFPASDLWNEWKWKNAIYRRAVAAGLTAVYVPERTTGLWAAFYSVGGTEFRVF